ncbi:conserved hypothetical protein [Talaromyces stipitatus ATCC 10500]|uniref:Uncharacterized protein n=1 Tax=Talaromyces stipitatus (strain ATCC 10500 / CBS 375.48 / QM 6759 / NRRL 1006) TaxID=441959 RepID=B8MGA9_TALSN|nr:uncharacterized protein TSTA_013320 [Talaromyces stipitatus ATCC 10500]EED16229.1 conserved hypothetical protein [Talaromyces stipitatus ATCC 10500]
MYLPNFTANIQHVQRRENTMNYVLPNITLDAAGLVAIAEITAVAQRTVLTGTSIYSDSLILCPGLHRQQSAPELNRGEFPAVAAMTSGYVFRVENPATVSFLQRHGVTGHLVTLEVLPISDGKKKRFSCCMRDLTSHLFYWVSAALSPVVLSYFLYVREWWGVFCLLVLMFARLCNVFVIRRRTKDIGWKGASEPGAKGDLLILMSGDCWIRLQGAVDDLKAVTSGKWWRERTMAEDCLTAVATVLVYINTALVSNIHTFNQIILLVMFVLSAALLFLANITTRAMHMYGRKIQVKGQPKKYYRRRDMADELIAESGRKDWARRLGLIVDVDGVANTPVIM